MLGATWNDVKAMPRPVWLLLLGTLVNRFGSFVIAFLVLYLTKAGYTAAQAGVAISAYGVGGLGAAAVGGYLTDRIGRRRTIAMSMFSSAIVMVSLTTTTEHVAIVVLAALAGFTSELYRPASAAYLTDLTEPGQRVTVWALYRLAINFGSAAGPAVGGFVAEYSFKYLFYGDAITSVIFGVMALTILTSTVHLRLPHTDATKRGTRRELFEDKGLLLFVVAVGLVAMIYMQGYSTFAVQVSAFGFPSKVYGLLIGLNGFLVMLMELPITAITRRFPARPVMALGALLVGAGFGLVRAGDSLPLLVTVVVVFTFGEMIQSPVGGAFISNRAPAHLRGRYMGAFGVAFSIGLILGPGLGTWVFQHNPKLLWTSCFIVGAISAILMAIIPEKRDSATAETPRA